MTKLAILYISINLTPRGKQAETAVKSNRQHLMSTIIYSLSFRFLATILLIIYKLYLISSILHTVNVRIAAQSRPQSTSRPSPNKSPGKVHNLVISVPSE